MIIDGKKCSENLREKLKQKVLTFKTKPKIVDIQIGDNAASDIYIKNKEKAALSVGMDFECIRFNESVEENTIISKIDELNNDKSINGILVQMPIPDKYNYKRIINSINPEKDVDGLTYINSGKLINNEEGMISCTPSGVIELLKYYNIEIEGKNVVIVGRSILVGKPLALLF